MDPGELFSLISLETVKKYSHVLKGLLVVFFAFILAMIINSELIAPALKLRDMDEIGERRSRPVRLKQSRRREYYDVIIDRNIFDSTDTPVPGGKLADSGEGGQFDPGAPAIPSGLPLKLIGTIVMNQPGWSIAVITGGDKTTSNVYKIKEIVLSSAVVVQIFRNRVILRNSGRLEYIEIKDEGPTFMAERPVGDLSVKSISDSKFVINRRELDEAFSDLATILTQARVVPHFEDGKATGFRIFAIQPGSIYKKLGINDHDIISRVNGVKIDDPMKGMQLFNSLKNESSIELDIIRDGVKKTIGYEVK